MYAQAYLLAHLATDVREARYAVVAVALAAPVAEHAYNLRVLLPKLLVLELALRLVAVALAAAAVLAALACCGRGIVRVWSAARRRICRAFVSSRRLYTRV
jgi:hypothetical protein